MAATLHRSERLRGIGAVRRLFESGQSGFVYPFRYLYFIDNSAEEQGVRVLFSTPKRFHKRANKRNRLRRQTKEAYRLQKGVLSSDLMQGVECKEPANSGRTIDIALIYSTKDSLPYKTISNAVKRVLEAVHKGL